MRPGSAADTLTVGPLCDGSAGRVRERPVHRLAQELQLRFYRRMLRCRKVFEKAVEQGAQSSADLHGRCPVVTDLGDGELKVVLPVTSVQDETRPATVVRHHVVVPKSRVADHGEERLDVIEYLNSCRGVVDSWGEGPDGDVHENPKGEGGILFDGAFGTQGDETGHVPGIWCGRTAVDLDEDGAGRDVVSDEVGHDERAVVAHPGGHQAGHVECLDGSAAGRADERHRVAPRHGLTVIGCGCADFHGPAGEDPFSHAPDEVGDGHRPEVVREPIEIDEQEQKADCHSRAGEGDPEVWYRVRLDAAQQEKANAKVPVKVARTVFWSRSLYQRRIYLADSAPVACWMTSTPIVTTKPSSATIAPTMELSTPLAVVAE